MAATATKKSAPAAPPVTPAAEVKVETPPPDYIQKPKEFDTFQKVADHAKEKGVEIPKGKADEMRNGMATNRVNGDYLAKIIDRVAEKKVNASWIDKPRDKDGNLGKTQIASVYSNDKQGKIAQIIEHKPKDGGDKYYSTQINKPAFDKDGVQVGKKWDALTYTKNKVDDNGKDVLNEHGGNVKTSHLDASKNIEAAKSKAVAYHMATLFNEATKEIRAEFKQEKEQSQQVEKAAPEQSKGPSLTD